MTIHERDRASALSSENMLGLNAIAFWVALLIQAVTPARSGSVNR